MHRGLHSSALISVNDRFIVYGIKGGHIRVIEKRDAMRTLLRGHSLPVQDCAFFSKTSDVLGSIGGEGGSSKIAKQEQPTLLLFENTAANRANTDAIFFLPNSLKRRHCSHLAHF